MDGNISSLRRAANASVGAGTFGMTLILILAIHQRRFDELWLIIPISMAALPWLLLAGGEMLTIGLDLWVRWLNSRPMAMPADRNFAPVLLNAPAARQMQKQSEREAALAAWCQWVRGCERNTDLRFWQKQGYDIEQVRRWRDQLIHAGLARWKGASRNAGWELTVSAEQIIRGLR